jgi:hypothetical protein
MEYDSIYSGPQGPSLSSCSHDFLDFEFPSDEAILEVMASFNKKKEYVTH